MKSISLIALTSLLQMISSVAHAGDVLPGAVTGLERETVLYSALEASDDGCELASRIETLRVSRRPGGTDRSFDVTTTRVNEIGRKGFDGVVSFQDRESVVRVTILNPERVRRSQIACDEKQRNQNAIDQFNATVEAKAFVCAMHETKASPQPTAIEKIEEKLLDLLNIVKLSPGLEVKVRGGRDALISEIRAARSAISKMSIETAHAHAKSILAAVDDGTQFPKDCAPGALYLWRLNERPSNQAAR